MQPQPPLNLNSPQAAVFTDRLFAFVARLRSYVKMDITTLLVNAQSADQTIRKAAEHALNAAQESAEYGAFWLQCAGELASDAKPLEVRQLAGLILKNALDAKEDARRSLCRVRSNPVR